MPPRKDRKIVVLDGWSMRLKTKRKDGLELYYCTERNKHAKCAASFVVDQEKRTYTVKRGHSRHDKDRILADSYIFRQELKEKAQTGNPRQIIDEVREKHLPAVSIVAGSYNAKRKVLYRAKGKVSEEIQSMNAGGPIARDFATTLRGEPFLIADDSNGGSRILMFASNEGLELLSQGSILFADGTFTVPTGFYQLYSIHTYINPTVTRPVVFILLKDKLKESYIRMLRILKADARLANWNPQLVLLDFENGSKAAFEAVFPTIYVETCLFHIVQCWRKQAEKMNIYDFFIDDGCIVDFWARLKALAFLAPQDVEPFYNELLTTVPPNSPAELRDFLHYLERNYMLPSSRFPSSLWSCHFRTLRGIHRTSDSIEVWHRMIEEVEHEKNGLAQVQLSDIIARLRREDRHTVMDAAELQINPLHLVNKSRKNTNILKDQTLLKVLQNDPPPPNHPLAGVNFLDAIAFASHI